MNENYTPNAINPNEENINNNPNNASNTFNLIIGIATLLIAILGATFAYFSATAQSLENDVTVKSAYVSISYDGGNQSHQFDSGHFKCSYEKISKRNI